MSDIYWKRYSVIFSTMKWNENAHSLSHESWRPESQKCYGGDPDVPIKFVRGERIPRVIRDISCAMRLQLQNEPISVNAADAMCSRNERNMDIEKIQKNERQREKSGIRSMRTIERRERKFVERSCSCVVQARTHIEL